MDYQEYQAEEHLIDRRLVTISADIKNRITTMGTLFVLDKIIDPSILSADRVLLSRLKAMSGINHQ